MKRYTESAHDEYIATTPKWKGGGTVRRTLEDAQADIEEAISRKPYPVDDPSPRVTREDFTIYKRRVSEWRVYGDWSEES